MFRFARLFVSLILRRNLWTAIPLSVRIIVGVALGVGTGLWMGKRAIPIGDMCFLLIDLLKAMATPLIFFAVIDALLRTKIPPRKGALLLCISLINATVAIAIGLGVSNTLRLGELYKKDFRAAVEKKAGPIVIPEKKDPAPAPAPATAPATEPAKAEAKKDETKKDDAKKAEPKKDEPTLDPLANFASYIPKNLIDPFQKNSIITVVLLAVFSGVALRTLKSSNSPETVEGILVLETAIRAIFQAFTLMLDWVIQLIPIAVFGVVAKVVGQTGTDIFEALSGYLVTVLLGLFLHAVVYYSIILFVVGRVSPRKFFAGAFDAIVTALSCGSSLATLPVTLRCLNDKLKVTPASARLAACVGTNLNHDGIILYEAAAVIFIAQAFDIHLGFSQQIVVALASIMAGIGIAGVPEAGLISLQLVMVAAGLPAEICVAVTPVIFTVDWIIGRCRAATNVVSDMTVATLLDRLDPTPAEEAAPVLLEVNA